ncbi:MAG: hypothetical protein M0009_03450 [Deltaproteobacteria bacterium]|nr:hypothetical protein [Deltaproteobacteria bacterium]
MKRFLMIAAVFLLLCLPMAFAAEKPPVSAPLPPSVPEMSTAGRIVEISESLLKIERTLKGKTEIMEFTLEKPFSGLAVGDPIKASYREKDGRNILLRIAPAKMTAVQKKGKPEPAKATKNTLPASGQAVK